MSILDKVKGALFEEVPEAEKKTQPPQPSIPSLSSLSNVGATASFSPVVGVSQEDIEKFMNQFDELLEKSNLPGPDYYEFMKMTQAMPTLTDDVKYPAAFSALKVQGLSKQSLLDTAQQYIDILRADKEKFSQALESKVVSEINKKKANLSNSQDSIKQKQEMIQQLQTEINKETTDILNLTQEISSDEKKLSDKNTAYSAASEAKKNTILSDIQKINTYIK